MALLTLINSNVARSCLNLYRHTTSADLSTDISVPNLALHSNRVTEIDGARPCVRIQIEGRILWKTQLHTTRPRMKNPFPSGFAIRQNRAATGLGLQGTANIPQLETAGPGFRMHRSRGRLIQHQVSASGMAIEPAGYIRGPDITAPGVRIQHPLYAVHVNAA